MLTPPPTLICWPATKLESEIRNRTASATSPGSPRRPTGTRRRSLLDDVLGLLRRRERVSQHRGIDRTGRDTVREDAPASVLAHDGPEKGVQGGLDRGVRSVPGVADLGRLGGDADERSSLVLEHHREQQPGGQHRAEVVDGDLGGPVLLGRLQERRGTREAAVVDHRVDPARVGEEAGDARPDRPGIPHVERHRPARRLLRVQRGGQRLGSLPRHVPDRHRPAVVVQAAADRLADRTAATGDERHSARADAAAAHWTISEEVSARRFTTWPNTLRPTTMRWIWFVPSTICPSLASRYRCSTG